MTENQDMRSKLKEIEECLGQGLGKAVDEGEARCPSEGPDQPQKPAPRALLEDSGHMYLARSTAIVAADDCHGQETQVLLGRCSSNCNLIHCYFGLSIGVWVLRGLP